MPFPADTIISYNTINKQIKLLNQTLCANWITKLVKCHTGYESDETVQWHLYAPICNVLPEKIESRLPIFTLLKEFTSGLFKYITENRHYYSYCWTSIIFHLLLSLVSGAAS